MSSAVTRRMFVFAAAVPLLGCTAQGARFMSGSAPAESSPLKAANTGTIYIYRPLGTSVTRGESPFISVARKSYGKLRAGGFIRVDVPEGDVDVAVQQSVFVMVPTIPRIITVAVVAGTESYVRVDQKIDDTSFQDGVAVNQSIDIEEVPGDIGRAELAQTRENG